MMQTLRRPDLQRRRTIRTCVGCGMRDDAAALVRLALAGGEVVCGARPHPGRGAHVHPRSACILAAPRTLPRAFRSNVRADGPELGRRLASASEQGMVVLLLAARRLRALAVGPESASDALDEGAPLAVVAADAGGLRGSALDAAIVGGRAIAWRAKEELGALLGREEVDVCAVRDERIASGLKRMRAAVDAGMMAARKGEKCSKRPEAR